MRLASKKLALRDPSKRSTVVFLPGQQRLTIPRFRDLCSLDTTTTRLNAFEVSQCFKVNMLYVERYGLAKLNSNKCDCTMRKTVPIETEYPSFLFCALLNTKLATRSRLSSVRG